jgi:alpha-N-arabinofuranosidase
VGVVHNAVEDVIVKVVNTDSRPQQATFDLRGLRSVKKTATAEVLSGEPLDVNSVAEPERIAPKTIAIDDAGPTFLHEFPPYSVSVIRLKTKD